MPAPSELGHELRATRVGASEVGALVGFHPYTAPADIWARIMGYAKPKPQTSAMAAGNALEEPVARMWAAQTGKPIRKAWRSHAHPDVPLVATPDYWVPPDALLEVKVSGDWELWASLPQYVYWQAMAQIACTGRQRCHVAALLGSSLKTFVVERDAAAIRDLEEAVAGFARDYLETGAPPPDAPAELVLKVLPPEVGTMAADERLESVAYRMSLAREQMQRGEAAMSSGREVLAEAMKRNGARQIVGRGWTFGLDARGALLFRGSPQGANGGDHG